MKTAIPGPAGKTEQAATQHSKPVLTQGDQRPQSLALQMHQDHADRSTQAMQLKTQSALMANSPRATQMKALAQLMAHASANRHKPVQRMADEEPLQARLAETVKPDRTGLPRQLKAGVESLSGMSLDHVSVYYNSDKPAQLQAHAYAQGSDIHVAPGQEQHLPHEAWHVVQQAQGRVRPTLQMKTGVAVNDDQALEAEADVMGAKAMQLHIDGDSAPVAHAYTGVQSTVAQRALVKGKLNVVGENHDESDPRRVKESTYTKSELGEDAGYWGEGDFATGDRTGWGDPKHLRLAELLSRLNKNFTPLEKLTSRYPESEGEIPADQLKLIRTALKVVLDTYMGRLVAEISVNIGLKKAGKDALTGHMDQPFVTWAKKALEIKKDIIKLIAGIDQYLIDKSGEDELKLDLWATCFSAQYFSEESISALYKGNTLITEERSFAMEDAASQAHDRKGVWKIGQAHVEDIKLITEEDAREYHLMDRSEFNDLLPS
ncbi:DUF4157 domain-containing protein [Undibacterium sp. TJN19]|uniref:eCIS core domain-containing protein n=1 Tax=Undibacterium sp. TJN19 TaxID=3413055 RepID=UPI003BF36534